jgi:hypothetical protein
VRAQIVEQRRKKKLLAHVQCEALMVDEIDKNSHGISCVSGPKLLTSGGTYLSSSLIAVVSFVSAVINRFVNYISHQAQTRKDQMQLN